MIRALFASTLLVLIQTSLVLGDEVRTISVAGVGKITVEPDSVRIEMEVSFSGMDLRVAKPKVDKVMAALLEVVKQMKVAEDDVTATELQVHREYGDESQNDINLEVSRSITVTLRQIAQLEEFLNASIEAGANRINSIVLETSKEKDLRDKALTLAINDAKQQANKIAAGLGVKIGKVHKVTGDEGPYVTLLSAPINGLSAETYRPAKIKVSVGIGVVFQLD
jgi:uncharacterized protein YggE